MQPRQKLCATLPKASFSCDSSQGQKLAAVRMPAFAAMTGNAVQAPEPRSRLHDPAKIASLRPALAPVRQREIVGRAHFVETRGGALEFELLRALRA